MCDNIRDGNEKVYFLKVEVRRSIEKLQRKCCSSRSDGIEYTARVERQIMDGLKFLEMLSEPVYSNCKTLDELKQRISRRRNILKEKLVKLDATADGHQVSIFDIYEEVSEEERKEHAKAISDLKEEIHWLHKCLGICKNSDYFK